MDLQWWEILGYVVGIAGAILGGVFYARWNKMVKLLKELGEAFTRTSQALEDKELARSEAVMLLKEWRDVIDAFLDLMPSSVRRFF